MARGKIALSIIGLRRRRASRSLIQLHIDDDEVVGCKSLLEHGSQLFASRYADTFGTKKLGADDAAAIGFYLVALHAAIGVVAQDQDKDWNLVIACGGKLLLLHHERTVACHADHTGVGAAELDSHCSGQRGADGTKLAGMNDRSYGVNAA